MLVVRRHLHGDHLVRLCVDGELELPVSPFFPVEALDPPSGRVDLYAGGVDGYGDGLVCLSEAPVRVMFRRRIRFLRPE